MGKKTSSPDKIIRILKEYHISATYYPCDFTSETNYARFELTTKKEIAKGLEATINSNLKLQKNKFITIRTIDTKTIKEGKLYRYVLEIVPDKNLNSNRKTYETEEFLRDFPKDLKSYLKMNKCES